MRISAHDPERQEIFSRRTILFGGVTSLLFAGVAGRLYQLQIVDHDKYVDLALDNQFNRRILTPLRGEIVDRFGVVLASNRQNFRLLFIPERTKDTRHALDRISQVIDLSEEKRARILNRIKRRGAFVPVEIEDNLSWDQFSKISFDLPHLPGVLPNVGDTRDYPLGEAAAFVIGYVGAVTERDLEAQENDKERTLLRQPGFKVGRDGLERTYDEELRGKAGEMQVKVNAHGRVIDELKDDARPPVQGKPLALTIDAELQVAAMKELEGESAAAVVLDAVTGDILVLASTPAFDPNAFNVGVDPAMWKELSQSPYKPLMNKPLAGAYPPGSTLKPASAIAAQVAGFKTNHKVRCLGKTWFGDRYFHCWRPGGHGVMDMRDAIKHSCDVYFWEIAKTLEIDILSDTTRKLGLGQAYELGIPGQKPGVVPSREWKRTYFAGQPENQTWFQGETLSAIIGQGAVTTTPLQLAVMAARIATGRAIRPRIVRAIGDLAPPTPQAPPINLDQSYFEVARAGMDAVTNEIGGTAWRSRLEKPEWRLAGKTGTSQVRRITAEERARGVTKNEDLPWERRDHALFICFAPVDNPRYACAVVVEHGGGGSRMAGPKAREIMRAVMKKDPASRPPIDPRTLAARANGAASREG
ncbi:MAG: penicillin-binding protein 2 [Parvularculaceae bacterium]